MAETAVPRAGESGPLADPGLEGLAAEQAPELIAAVAAVRAGEGDMDQVMQLLRSATLWVETDSDEHGHAVRSVAAQGLSWLPVFSSLPRLALFAQAAGRGAQQVTYGTLTGAELLDTCLPELPVGTGLVLDAVSEHVLALPPVRGIVPESLAVSAEPGQG